MGLEQDTGFVWRPGSHGESQRRDSESMLNYRQKPLDFLGQFCCCFAPVEGNRSGRTVVAQTRLFARIDTDTGMERK